MEETAGAPSSFAALSPRRLRASSRDGGGIVNRPPSSLTMLLSRHTRRRDVLASSHSRAHGRSLRLPIPFLLPVSRAKAAGGLLRASGKPLRFLLSINTRAEKGAGDAFSNQVSQFSGRGAARVHARHQAARRSCAGSAAAGDRRVHGRSAVS